jgi:MSHA biogenesis protein MshL
LLALLLAGCSSHLTRDAQTGEAIQQAFELKQGEERGAPPEEISQALLPPVQLQLPGVDQRAGMEQRFDVKVRRVRARDFFLSLVEDTPYGMVIDPQVGGYISLDMKNVTVPEVMQVVRSVHGYDYKMHGHTIQVFPNTMHTRLFQVDYLAVKRAGESLTTSKTGQISTNSSEGENGGASRNSSAITTSSESDFWASLKTSLSDLIGSEEGRRIAINPQTGMVMVRAMPDELRIVEEYLDASQHTLKRQVILEARILEVALNDAFQSGINWSSLQQSGNRTLLGSQVGGGSIFGGSGISNLNGNEGILNPAAPSNVLGSATSAFGGVFTLAVNTSDFTAFIELLKTQGDVQVLSSPRVSTVNNQKAVIKVGSDEFYVTSIDTDTTTTAGTGTTNLSVELEPFFSGVALDVTPQISERGDIVLHIHPAVSEVAEQTKSVTTTLGTLTLPLAASNIRESDTVIRAANNQVVVIGGLMQNITEDQDASVPLLGDIPLIGGLFSHTKKQTRKSELVILLKPVVVDEGGYAWQQQMERSSGAIREMSRGL